MSRYPLLSSLLLSVILHLTAVTVVGPFWSHRQEARLFRTRLAEAPRFAAPPRAAAPASAPAAIMEYVPSRQQPVALTDVAGTASELALVEPGLPDVPYAAAVEIGAPEGAGLPGRPADEPSPTGPTRVDTAGMESRELLRIEDMARAGDRRAVIIPDPQDRRNLQGFIHFTLLKMDGVGCSTGCSQLVGDLARYTRDHTRLLAQVQGTPVYYFLSPELLRDPVHFFFRAPRLKGDISQQSIYLSDEEVKLLGRYLRGGGFVFAETEIDSTGDSRAVYTWFSELLAYLRVALEPDGRVVPLSFEHGVYHSFFDFPAGFPQELPRRVNEGPRPAWFYPERAITQSPRGLYGVELNGELVAVLSDLGLHTHWAIPSDPGGSGDAAMSTEVALRAGVNLVVHALTRQSNSVARRAAPAWESRRPHEPAAELPRALAANADPGEFGDRERADGAGGGLYADLPASLALVLSPLGDRLGPGLLEVVVDGQTLASVADPGAQAVVLRGLEPRTSQVEVTYGGRTARAVVDLRGGRTATLTFGLARLLFLERLRLRLEPGQLWTDRWLGRFSDLELTIVEGGSYDDLPPNPAEQSR